MDTDDSVLAMTNERDTRDTTVLVRDVQDPGRKLSRYDDDLVIRCRIEKDTTRAAAAFLIVSY